MNRLAPLLAVIVILGSAPWTVAEDGWFVSFERVSVAPVKRTDVTQLVDAGSFEADGFRDLVISLGGEFKEGLPRGGRVGAILLPDEEIVDYLLRNEGMFVFPLEVTFDVDDPDRHMFVSEQKLAKVAFPRYRIYLYNETTSAATVSLFVYRSR